MIFQSGDPLTIAGVIEGWQKKVGVNRGMIGLEKLQEKSRLKTGYLIAGKMCIFLKKYLKI